MRTRKIWIYMVFTVAILLSSGSASALTEADCRGCHGLPAGGSTMDTHHALYYSQGLSCETCHPGSVITRDCFACHMVVADHPTCVNCHSIQQGIRRAASLEFSMSSHHVQTGSMPANGDCEVCHDQSTHKLGSVRLRVGTSSIVYTDENSGNAHCLSCHNESGKVLKPFADLKTPVSSPFNWDGKSVDLKYSSTEVVSSNKYPPTTGAPNMGGFTYNTVPDIKRALSAHGNPAMNQANGDNNDKRVPCLSCHNSHGSPASPLLYSTAAYVPASIEEFCWDCHNNEARPPRVAGNFLDNDEVRDYFGGFDWGMNDGTGFKMNWMGTFPGKNAPYESSHFYPSKRKVSDNNWQRSILTCTNCHDPHGVDPGLTDAKAYMVPMLKGTWLVSPYKEDRAPLSSFASPYRDAPNNYSSGDQPRANPDLVYNNTPVTGSGYANGTGQGHEGYFIDENTFGVYDPVTRKPAVAGSWKSVLNNNQVLQINRIAETDAQFGGLCLNCHPQADLVAAWPGHKVVKGWGGATQDLFPSSLANSPGSESRPKSGMHGMGRYGNSESEQQNSKYARGYRWGVNPEAQQTAGYVQADYHQFPCSKCHTPHATNHPRLLVTNCLDSAGNHTAYPGSKTVLASNCHSTERNLSWNMLTPYAQASPNTHVIVASTNEGGGISPEGSVYVDTGASQSFSIFAGAGFKILDVHEDGVSKGAVTSHTVSNVTGNHNVSVTFGSTSNKFFAITASAGVGGTLSPPGIASVGSGMSQTYTFFPGAGSRVADVVVDGLSMGELPTYTFSLVTANHTISASFAQNTRVIVASAGANGTISPAGTTTLAVGAGQSYTFTPNTGYKVIDVQVDNVSVGAVTSYTFSNVSVNHLISVAFDVAPVTYTLATSAGTGGTISPSGNVVVGSGVSQTFTIAPNSGYKLSSVTVDGASQGAVSSYTFTNVTANHTISATFAVVPVYTITASAGTGGTISPTGGVAVSSGNSQTFAIAPSAGKAISSVTVDGVSKGAIASYTFTNVTANHTISATFVTTYTLTASAGTGGTMTPSGGLIVNSGASQTFTIAGNAGQAVAAVTVDGASKGAITSYTFSNVTANHTISATFVTAYTITASAGTGGTISPSGDVAVNSGATQAFTITANTGQMISAVTVDNVSQGAISSYTFTNVTAIHTIGATFTVAPVNIALNKTATASSTYSSTYAASKAVDGSASTYWRSSSTGTQWLQVDLQSNYILSGVKVSWPATYYAKSFQIQTSTDGTNFTSQYTTTTGNGTAVNISLASITARYVRVNCTAANSSSYQITELELYGTAAPNQAPVANAGVDKTGTAGTAISFTGSGTDSDGTIAGYSWNWGDNTAVTNTQNASHTYAAAGTYIATLTVTDNKGATGTDTATVTVSPAPPVNLALNKTATASTTRSSTYAASKAVDGSTTTSWMSSTTSSTQWMRVDLGSSQNITNVKVTWPATYFAIAFTIDTSTDGNSWTTRYSTTTGTGALTNATFAAVSARYVRVNCTTRNNSSYYGVSELALYP